MHSSELIERIHTLKKQTNTVILVHNYQQPEIQDIGDYLGDSLGLSREAAHTDAETILFCGVHFMAQTAKLLSPAKTVLLPDLTAGCPMANMVTPEQLREFKAQHPGCPVVAYVNTTAETKAEVDICCTSANALQVVRSLPEEKILFVPDQYLASWVQEQVPEKTIIAYPGFCPVHVQINPAVVMDLKEAHPAAVVMCHPECPPDLRRTSDHILSTDGMRRFAAQSDATEFIVVTERNMGYRLGKDNPGKTFHVIDTAICPNMRKTTMEKVVESLEKRQFAVEVPEDIASKARLSVERMIAIR